MKCCVALLSALMLGAGLFSPALAHTTVGVGGYEIEVGWGTEPPVVGFRNEITFEVSTPGEAEGVKTAVKNAFQNMDATAKFGGITKKLDINSATTPGHYFSNIIPTKTGSIAVVMSGGIKDTPVNVEIPVEDVEGTAVLDFPPRSDSGDTAGLKSAMSVLQKEIRALQSGTGSDGNAYNFAVFGLSLGAAGVILAIVAMLKRK